MRRSSRREKDLTNPFSAVADDDWYDEPELEIGELPSTLLPSSAHNLSARRKLDRFLEQRRLDMDLRDMFDEDDDESRPRQQPQQRARRKPLTNA